MNNNLTIEDLLKVIELYQNDLNSAVASKMIAMAILERKEKELEVVKKELEAVKKELEAARGERVDVNGVQ